MMSQKDVCKGDTGRGISHYEDILISDVHRVNKALSQYPELVS